MQGLMRTSAEMENGTLYQTCLLIKHLLDASSIKMKSQLNTSDYKPNTPITNIYIKQDLFLDRTAHLIIWNFLMKRALSKS